MFLPDPVLHSTEHTWYLNFLFQGKKEKKRKKKEKKNFSNI
jgi:hypothetical protein